MRDAKGKFCKIRPFKVGDRVKITTAHPAHAFPVGEIGTVKRDDGSNAMPFIVEDKTQAGFSLSLWMDAKWLALEHGPASPLTPTSEEPREAVLIRERDEAREEAERLKADLDVMRDTPKECRQELTENYKNYRKADDRRSRRGEASRHRRPAPRHGPDELYQQFP